MTSLLFLVDLISFFKPLQGPSIPVAKDCIAFERFLFSFDMDVISKMDLYRILRPQLCKKASLSSHS